MAKTQTAILSNSVKLSLGNRLLNELLFWLHTLSIVAIVLLGLFVPLFVYVLFYVLYDLHIQILKGCAITLVQHKTSGLSKDRFFVEVMVERFTGIRLNDKQVQWFSTGIEYSSLLVAITAEVARKYL